MAKPLIELDNPMLNERHAYRSPEPVVMYQPDPVCPCCGKAVEVKEFITQDGEWLFSESCWTQLSYKEGWIRKVAV